MTTIHTYSGYRNPVKNSSFNNYRGQSVSSHQIHRPAIAVGAGDGGRFGWVKMGDVQKSLKNTIRETIEDRFVYIRKTGNTGKDFTIAEVPYPELKRKIEEKSFITHDGLKLYGWFIKPKPGKPTALISHGNKGTLSRDSRVKVMKHFVERGWGVFSYDYRGYGKSEGTPNAHGLHEDARSASCYLEKELRIPLSQTVAVGESLGGGVTVQLAAEHEEAKRPFRAMVLYSTFSSLKDVIGELKTSSKFRFLNRLLSPILSGEPVESLFNGYFDSQNTIKRIQHTPVFIAHLNQDDMIPLAQSEHLFKNIHHVPHKRHLKLDGVDHNGMFEEDVRANKLLDEVEAFLKETQLQPISTQLINPNINRIKNLVMRMKSFLTGSSPIGKSPLTVSS